MRRPSTIAAVTLLGLAALVAPACGGSGSSAGCGPIRREALDPQFLVHVLGDAPGLRYTSDPPTSGPHQPTPPVSGVRADAIPKPVQVGILEAGDVLLQHAPELPAADRARLEALAGPHVVVAPNPGLDDDHPVVATAWQYKRSCTAVDVAGLREFISARAGKGPGGPTSP